MVCPTCGILLQDRMSDYNKKARLISESSDKDETKNKNLEDLMNSYKFKRECCKIRLYTCVDLIETIK
jgi:DNA-directed RNA polymerase subunit N (RpoN/RPB10)